MDDTDHVRYRFAAPEDVLAVARLFRRCKAYSVWAQLGDDVAESYFRHYCSGGHGLVVVATSKLGVLGACIGTTDPAGDRRQFYRENGRQLLWLIAKHSVAHPRAILVMGRRTLTAVKHLGTAEIRRLLRGRGPRADWNARPVGEREGTSTCFIGTLIVDPVARGRGVATTLLRNFREEGAKRGFCTCYANTTEDNVGARLAMERAGFQYAWRAGARVTYVSRITGT